MFLENNDRDLFYKKLMDKSGGLMIALICEAMNWSKHLAIPNPMRSIYNVANMFEKLWSDLLSSESNRQAYYQDWVKRHPLMTNGEAFPSSLEAQEEWVQMRHTTLYNALTVACHLGQQMPEISELMGKAALDCITEAMEKLAKANELIAMGIYFIGVVNKKLPFRLGPSLPSLPTLKKLVLVDDPVGNQLATLVISVFITKGVEPRFALGYNGPDKPSSDFLKNKLIPVNQTPWLFTHSGMRVPTNDLMNNVYKQFIMTGPANDDKKAGITKFGIYYDKK